MVRRETHGVRSTYGRTISPSLAFSDAPLLESDTPPHL